MKILLINPNTSDSITQAMARGARAVAAAASEIVPVTAPFGSNLVSSLGEGVIAAHATLAAIAENARGCDAAIIGAFGDYGIEAARQIFPLHVVGMGESAIQTVRLIGAPFAIITVGRAMTQTLQDFAEAGGVGNLLTGVRVAIDIAGGARPSLDELIAATVDAGRECIKEFDAEVLLLAGAPMAEVGAVISENGVLPIIEGIASAVRFAEMMGSMGLHRAKLAGQTGGKGKDITGVSEPLATAILESL